MKFSESSPHKYFIDVLEHFEVLVHKHYTKSFGRVKEDTDRYNFFISEISFEGKTGYIFGPECGDAYFEDENERDKIY